MGGEVRASRAVYTSDLIKLPRENAKPNTGVADATVNQMNGAGLMPFRVGRRPEAGGVVHDHGSTVY